MIEIISFACRRRKPASLNLNATHHCMRTLMILALVLSQARLASASESCTFGSPSPYDKVLTKDELNAVLANRPGANVVLREAAAGQVARTDSPTSRDSRRHALAITPEQAERLIVLGTIRMMDRHLDGTTYLTSRTNHVYLVKKASDDRLQNAVVAVDPCHVFITVWLE
jgi:hypothetical protein